MNQTWSRRGPAEARTVSVALRYETSGSAAFSAAPGESRSARSCLHFFFIKNNSDSPYSNRFRDVTSSDDLICGNLRCEDRLRRLAWSVCHLGQQCALTIRGQSWLRALLLCCGEKQASRCHAGQRAAGMESQSPAVRSVYGGGLCLRMSPCGLFMLC